MLRMSGQGIRPMWVPSRTCFIGLAAANDPSPPIMVEGPRRLKVCFRVANQCG